MIKNTKGKIDKIINVLPKDVGAFADEPDIARANAKEKRLAEWTEFLVDDCDNDWVDLLALILFKLSRMRKTMERSTTTLGNKKIAADINKAEGLLEKVLMLDCRHGGGVAGRNRTEAKMKANLKKAFKIVCDHFLEWWV
jgi:hypothetical protein